MNPWGLTSLTDVIQEGRGGKLSWELGKNEDEVENKKLVSAGMTTDQFPCINMFTTTIMMLPEQA